MHSHPEFLIKLLAKRGLTEEAEIEKFLSPDYERDLLDPFLMRDMERACVRLYEAMEAGEKITIYSDYDADGIPGAVILEDLLKKIGYFNYDIYIPGRNSEGYGLNLEAIEELKKNKTKLLLTVDLGITAINEIAQAEADGMDVIVLDHHLPKMFSPLAKFSRVLGSPKAQPDQLENFPVASEMILPRAYAILNPKIDEYPEKMLCAAGVVFKFVQGFLKKYGENYKIKNGWEKWLLDMAGLATLSDQVPLRGENRAFAYFGLKVLRKSPRPGLQKLLTDLKIDQRYLSEDDLGYMIVPRLNAASRMDDPRRAYELLSTEDVGKAGALALHLAKINDERKLLVAQIMKEVHKNFEKKELREVIVVGNPKWKVGVLGLVAGKLSDQYNRPVFVWGKDENDLIKGSCRSPGSISVVELMTEAGDHFLEFGGHELAGGFTVPSDKIHFLEENLEQIFNRKKKNKIEIKENYDLKLSLSEVNHKNWKEIEKLAPFGCENEKPIFLFENVKIEKIKKFGKNGSGEHLEIIFSENGEQKVAVSFFSGLNSFSTPIVEGRKVNLLANFDLSRFRGREELRLRIVDVL